MAKQTLQIDDLVHPATQQPEVNDDPHPNCENVPCPECAVRQEQDAAIAWAEGE